MWKINQGKKNKEVNLIANSIFELGKNLRQLLAASQKQLNKVVNRLGVAKDVFNDSRGIMNELKKIDLINGECFFATEKILSMPHRLHMFWGSDDADRLAFVKPLI